MKEHQSHQIRVAYLAAYPIASTDFEPVNQFTDHLLANALSLEFWTDSEVQNMNDVIDQLTDKIANDLPTVVLRDHPKTIFLRQCFFQFVPGPRKLKDLIFDFDNLGLVAIDHPADVELVLWLHLAAPYDRPAGQYLTVNPRAKMTV